MPRPAPKYAWPRRGTVCRRLLDLLRDGRAHEYPEIVDALYGDDEDGGPLNARPVIRLMVMRLRDAGWAILLERNGVYRLDLTEPAPPNDEKVTRWPARVRRKPRVEAADDGIRFNQVACIDWPGHPMHGVTVLVKRRSRSYRTFTPEHPEGISLGVMIAVRPFGRLSADADFLLPPDRLDFSAPASPDFVSRETSAQPEGVAA